MSYPNQSYTEHLISHLPAVPNPIPGCEYCEARNDWPPADWSEKDLEQYAEAMQREMADHQRSTP